MFYQPDLDKLPSILIINTAPAVSESSSPPFVFFNSFGVKNHVLFHDLIMFGGENTFDWFSPISAGLPCYESESAAADIISTNSYLEVRTFPENCLAQLEHSLAAMLLLRDSCRRIACALPDRPPPPTTCTPSSSISESLIPDSLLIPSVCVSRLSSLSNTSPV